MNSLTASLLALGMCSSAFAQSDDTSETKPVRKHRCSSPEEIAQEQEKAKPWQKKLAEAESLKVYEGLPSDIFETEAFKKEVTREDLLKVDDYHFYSPAVDASNLEDLKKVLSSPDLITKRAPAKCGFHPDYAFEWKTDGKVHHMFLCFGCCNVLFKEGDTYLMLDFAKSDELKKVLAVYDLKRPKRLKAEE